MLKHLRRWRRSIADFDMHNCETHDRQRRNGIDESRRRSSLLPCQCTFGSVAEGSHGGADSTHIGVITERRTHQVRAAVAIRSRSALVAHAVNMTHPRTV